MNESENTGEVVQGASDSLAVDQDAKREKARKRRSQARKRFFRTPEGRKLAARFREDYSGCPQKKNLGRTGPGRKLRGTSRPIESWEIAKLLTGGKTAIEAADVLRVNKRTVESRATGIGLALGTAFVCDRGKPFTDRSLVALRLTCGFTAAKFEKLVGLPERTMDRRKSDMLRDPAVALPAIQWRDRTLRLLLDGPIPAFPNHRILKSFFPNLREIDSFLYKSLSRIQAQLQENGTKEWTIGDVWNLVCEKVQRARATDEQWGGTLCYMWQIEEFLEKNLSRLRDTKYLATLVHELIGWLSGTTGFTVKRALPKSVRPIPPGEICRLILLHGVPLPTGVAALPTIKRPTRPGRGGRQRLDRNKRRFFQIGEAVAQRLTRCAAGLQFLKELRRSHPMQPAHWKSELEKKEYASVEIDALMTSKTAEGAAERCVARILRDSRHPGGLKLSTVQVSYAEYKAALQAPCEV